MKKNNMMRIASVLLVAVLLTTCIIAGTYAKYTSGATASDSARVAYWGWGFDADVSIDLFDADYADVVSSNTATPVNVVAPGTSKTATFNFVYTPKTAGTNDLSTAVINAPEVDYTFDVDFEVNPDTDYELLDANKNFTWTLKVGDGSVQTFQTVAELQAAVRALDGAAGADAKRWDAGTLPTNFYANGAAVNIVIGWNWEFTGTTIYNADYTEATTDEQKAAATALTQDQLDTFMGNQVDLDEVNFVITILAEQVNDGQ